MAPQNSILYPWPPFNVPWPPGGLLGPRLGTPDVNEPLIMQYIYIFFCNSCLSFKFRNVDRYERYQHHIKIKLTFFNNINLCNVEFVDGNNEKIIIYYEFGTSIYKFLVTTTGCVFSCWIYCYFWKFSTTIIKDLYTNKVDCVKQKSKKIVRSFASRIVWLFKLSQKLSNKFICFAHIHSYLFLQSSESRTVCMHIFRV